MNELDRVTQERDYFARRCVDLELEVSELAHRLSVALATRADSPLRLVSDTGFSLRAVPPEEVH